MPLKWIAQTTRRSYGLHPFQRPRLNPIGTLHDHKTPNRYNITQPDSALIISKDHICFQPGLAENLYLPHSIAAHLPPLNTEDGESWVCLGRAKNGIKSGSASAQGLRARTEIPLPGLDCSKIRGQNKTRIQEKVLNRCRTNMQAKK
jgi:hypothetical protein